MAKKKTKKTKKKKAGQEWRAQIVLTVEVRANNKTEAREAAAKVLKPAAEAIGLKMPIKELQKRFMVERKSGLILP